MYLNFNIKMDNLVIRKLLNMFGATWVCKSIFSGGHFIKYQPIISDKNLTS